MSLTKVTYSMIKGGAVNVFDFLTASQIAEVTSGNTPTTDLTSAIDNAVAKVAQLGGGQLIFPPGKYCGRIRVTTSNIEVIGYGAEVGFQNVDATLQIYSPDPGNSIPFNYSFVGGINAGVPNNVSPLATFYDIDTVTQGSDTISILGSAAGLAVGDWCMLMSGQNQASSVNNHIPQTHQFVKVRAINGLNISFDQVADASFNSTDDDPYLVKFPFLQNVTVRGFTLNNIAGGGAAYLYVMSLTNNCLLEDIDMQPGTNTGIWGTCENGTLRNVNLIGARGPFSNGRMCDNLTVENCTSKRDSASGFGEDAFYFSEENVKKLNIHNCRGLGGGVIVSMGTGYTNVTISDSQFDVYSGTSIGFGLATCPNANVTINNCTFAVVDGQLPAPWPAASPSVCVSMYSPNSNVQLNNCNLIQLGTGACWVTAFGSTLPQFSNTTVNGAITADLPYTNLYDVANSVYESQQRVYKITQNGQIEFVPFNCIITFGLNSPEGVVTASPGSLYLNRAGGAGTSLYVKESGSGNTGWAAK